MQASWLRFGAVLCVASVVGVAAGNAVTAGLGRPVAQGDWQSWAERFHQSPPGASAEHYYYGPDGPPAAEPSEPDTSGLQRVAENCDSCSDYDLGYRWAEKHAIGDVSRCLGFSWSYQRGCIAFAREGRGASRDPGDADPAA